MSNNWYIMLWRSSQDNPLYFAEPFTRWQARQDLLLVANHSDGFFYVRWNPVEVKRWQVARSEKNLCERWKRSRDKVRKFLNDLEKMWNIIQQKNRVCSIYIIVNYNKYQTTDHTTDQTTEKQQKNINNKNKEEIRRNKKTKTKKVAVVMRSEKEAIKYLKTKLDGRQPSVMKQQECLIHFFMTGYEYGDGENLQKINNWLKSIALEFIGKNMDGDVPRATMLWALKTYLTWQSESDKKVKNVKTSIRNSFINKRSYKW